MWEEAIPWIWGWAQGWLTPAVLFVLLNLVIGTIAVTSTGIVPRDPQPPGGAGAELHPADAAPRKLPRTPSRLLDRVRSFTLHPNPNPNPNLRGAAPPPRPQQTLVDPVPAAAEDENLADPEEDEVDEAEEELRLPHGHQLGRSHSDAHPAAGESPPPPLAARMKKSASEKSAFGHFEAAEVADAAAEVGDEDEAEDEVGGGGGGGGGEVDARADDFINRFRQQLKLQRLDSLMRYKETLNRNGGAGPGSTPPKSLE